MITVVRVVNIVPSESGGLPRLLTASHDPSRPAPPAHRHVPTVIAPLMVLGLGLWEMKRAGSDQLELQLQGDYLGRVVASIEAQIAVEPRRQGTAAPDVQFHSNGQTYGGPYALQVAREALNNSGTAVAIARWRQVLPPVTIGCTGLTAALSVLALVGATALARAGRSSRETLVRGFSVLRRLMPPLLGVQMLLLVIGAVTAVAFFRNRQTAASALAG